MTKVTRVISIYAALSMLASAPASAETNQWMETPEGVVREFIAALDHLDLERIMATQAPDATMFFPQPDATYRLNDRDAIYARMREAFDTWKQYANSEMPGAPHRLGLPEPDDLKVQIISDETAVVTWMFDRPGNFGRRTAVLVKSDDGWRMISFHSSNLRGQ